MNEKIIREVLKQAHKKIKLYFENDQEYIGGIPAPTLLRNIEEVLLMMQQEKSNNE